LEFFGFDVGSSFILVFILDIVLFLGFILVPVFILGFILVLVFILGSFWF